MLIIVAVTAFASAAETLFTSGPQEYEGRRYYWLAEWNLEVTIPDDVGASDRFEVLFGSKGPDRRTLHYEYDGKRGFLAEVRTETYQWIEVKLGRLARGKKVVLSGKGRENVAFLSKGQSLDMTPIPALFHRLDQLDNRVFTFAQNRAVQTRKFFQSLPGAK